MRKTWKPWMPAVLCVLLLFALAGAPVRASGATLYVVNPNSADRLNLRRSADTNAESLGRFYTGTAVEVLGSGNGYANVRIGSLSGYMQNSYLSPQRPDWQRGTWAVVDLDATGQQINLRAQASKTAAVLASFPNGTAVQILGESGEFYHVRTVDLDGYMQKTLLRDDPGKDGAMIAYTYGIVSSQNVNLRAFPSRAGVSMQQLSRGTRVEIMALCGPWYYVQVGMDSGAQRGFVLTTLVTGYLASDITQIAMINNPNESDRLNLRQGQGEHTRSLGRYYNGTQVNVLHQEGTWWYVRVGADGREGYMNSTYLQWLLPSLP